MSISILKDVALGDMLARYYIDDESKNVELQLLPAGKTVLPREAERKVIDSLIQVKIAGDIYHGGYAMGGTLRMGETTRKLRLKEQHVLEAESGM